MSKYDLNYMKQLKNRINNSEVVRIVLGAGDVWYGHDWIPTNYEELNVFAEEDWEFLFSDKKIDMIICEHVWEHLEEIPTAVANNCIHKHLNVGGNFRIAVPDGRFPSSEYIDHVRPDGIGSGSNDHKVLYTYELMKQRLESALFRVEMLEYWDENHEFICKEYDLSKGIISRSARFDERNDFDKKIFNYTSIIADAVK